MKNSHKQSKTRQTHVGAYITQAISQPDRRQDKTDIAMPNDENVTINREWVDENQK